MGEAGCHKGSFLKVSLPFSGASPLKTAELKFQDVGLFIMSTRGVIIRFMM